MAEIDNTEYIPTTSGRPTQEITESPASSCYAFAHRAPKHEPEITDVIAWVHWRRNQPDHPSLSQASKERFQRAKEEAKA